MNAKLKDVLEKQVLAVKSLIWHLHLPRSIKLENEQQNVVQRQQFDITRRNFQITIEGDHRPTIKVSVSIWLEVQVS